MERQEGVIKGIRFEIDYSYLRTTDVSWLFRKLRDELVKFLIDEHGLSPSDLRWARLPFEIEEVRTERSIVIDLFPLTDQGAWVWDSIARIAEAVLAGLIIWWIQRRVREEGRMPPFGRGRRNLRRLTTRSVERVTERENGIVREFVRESTDETLQETIEWRPPRRRRE